MLRPSIISRLDGSGPGPVGARAGGGSMSRHVLRRQVAKVSRWLHIYGSMGSLALVLFFALTGVTLNHQEWFASQQTTAERHGALDAGLLRTDSPDGVDKLNIVEHLRGEGGVRGALAEFRIGDAECDVAFKGPAYEASVVIDRGTGRYDILESRMGFAALVNDLHKGRDTGPVWKGVIDVSAMLLVFISLTGLILLYFVHKYRTAGVILFAAGGLISWAAYAVWVP